VDSRTPDIQTAGARYYYPENKILEPVWRDPPPPLQPWWRKSMALIIPLAVLALAALCLWFFWWGPTRNLKHATVLVMVDRDGNGEINRGDGQGTGVIISSQGSPGYVLTCRHVLMKPAESQCGYVEIWYRPGTPRLERIKKVDLEAAGEPHPGPDTPLGRDWAVLKFTRPGRLPHVKNSPRKDFNEEKKIKATGFPKGWDMATNEFGPAVKVLHGRLTRVDRNEQGAPIRLTHDADLAGGMSGGPLVMGGKIVGLNAQIRGVEAMQENYALPTYLLQETIFDRYQK